MGKGQVSNYGKGPKPGLSTPEQHLLSGDVKTELWRCQVSRG
jgi:hypothetical protein